MTKSSIKTVVSAEDRDFFREMRNLRKTATQIKAESQDVAHREEANELAIKQAILKRIFDMLVVHSTADDICAIPFPQNWDGHNLWNLAAEQNMRPNPGFHKNEWTKSMLPYGAILAKLYYAFKDVTQMKEQPSFARAINIACRRHWEEDTVKVEAYGMLLVPKSKLLTALRASNWLGNMHSAWWGIPLEGNVPFIRKMSGSNSDWRVQFPENHPMETEEEGIYSHTHFERRDHFWFRDTLDQAMDVAISIASQHPDKGRPYRLPNGRLSAPDYKSLRGMMTYAG